MINLTEIRESPIMARYLISSKSILAGDILIEELPFAIGPKLNSCVVCLGCYCKLDCTIFGSRCPDCKWPLCVDCVRNNSKVHSDECTVFKKAKVKFQSIDDDSNGCPQLDCIAPLRVLLKKETDPERWEKEVSPMEYHDEARQAIQDNWNADIINVASYIRGPCKLDRFSEELIMQVIGILEVNAFEGRTAAGYPIRCLYPMTGILAHSCVPNTARSIFPSEGFKIRLRAMVNLKEGQQLNHSYTYTLNGTAARQEHIRTGKFFTCKCERCTDPSELNTHFSSFKCTKCEPGLILTTDPLNKIAEWKCNHCNFKTSSDAINKCVSVMESEIDDIQKLEGPERLEHSERLLKKFSTVLHPMHFIQTNLRHSLIEMYGRVEGYGMADLPDVMLEHKKELCELVLRILNVFEPGLSRARALVLYEMHVPIVLIAKSGFIMGVLTGEALKSKLKQAVEILSQCVEILKYEDPASQEGILGSVAKTAMAQLQDSIKNI